MILQMTAMRFLWNPVGELFNINISHPSEGMAALTEREHYKLCSDKGHFWELYRLTVSSPEAKSPFACSF